MPFGMADFLSQVATRENIVTYKPGHHIFQVGETADKVFYLQQGKVIITAVSEQGKEVAPSIILAGQFFGVSCLDGEDARHTSAAPLGHPAVVIGIRKHAFQNLLANDQNFARAFIVHLIGRFDQMESDLLDHLFYDSEQVLAHVLLRLAQYGTGRDPQPFLGDISQETLALKVGTTRARVSKFMNKFRQMGFIDYDAGTIEVRPSLMEVLRSDYPGEKD